MVLESGTLSTELAEIFYETDLAFSRQVTPEDAKAFHEPTEPSTNSAKRSAALLSPV